MDSSDFHFAKLESEKREGWMRKLVKCQKYLFFCSKGKNSTFKIKGKTQVTSNGKEAKSYRHHSTCQGLDKVGLGYPY